MPTWREDTIQALKNLGGVAHLSEIHKEVEKLRKGKLNNTWTQTVQRELETYSSDSEAFGGGKDIFYMAEGKGKGIWGLRNINEGQRVFGEIEGIHVGQIFKDRKELAAAGIHAPPMGGIWGSTDEGASSIVLSGGYEDDIDDWNNILYTGQGGQDKPGGKQDADQEFTLGNEGLRISLYGFLGTDYTDSSSLNTWAASATGNRTPDNTSTWYTTNDATFEITGMQLEVGSQATAFEHRSYGEELSLCQRYYYTAWKGSGNGDFVTGSDSQTACEIGSYSSSEVYFVVIFPELMRDAPTLKTANVSSGLTIHRAAGNVTIDQGGWTNIIQAGKRAARVYTQTGSNRMSGNVSSGEPYALRMTAAGVYMAFDAEL